MNNQRPSVLDNPPHLELASHAVLLQRPGGELQVGLDPRTALIFLGPGFVDLLTALRTARISRAALARIGDAAGLTDRQVTWAVNRP